MERSPYLDRPLRTEAEALADIMAAPEWSQRLREDQLLLLERARELEVDVYLATARRLGCTRQQGKKYVLAWLYDAAPHTLERMVA